MTQYEDAVNLNEAGGGPAVGAPLEFIKWYTANWPPGCFVQVVAIEPVTDEAGGAPTVYAKTVATDAIEDLAGFIEEYREWNLYFSVNPLSAPLPTKAKKQHIAALACHHVDLDPPKAAMTPEEHAAWKAQTRRLIADKGLPPPSYLIDSGNGLGAFWRLTEPIMHDGSDEAPELEAVNRALASALGGDACHNLDRIMRLPGTTNWPDWRKLRDGRREAPTLLLESTDAAYGPAAFAGLPDAAATRQVAMPPTSIGTAINLDGYGLPDDQVALVAGALPKGERNEVMLGLLLGLLEDGHSRDDVLATIYAEPGLWQGYIVDKHPGDPEAFVLKELEKAWAKSFSGQLAPLVYWNEAWAEPGAWSLTSAGAIAPPPDPPNMLMERPLTEDLLTTPIPSWPCTIGRLLPKGVVTEVDGMHGIGKSWLALIMALCNATGLDWFDLPTEQGRTVFMSKEDPYEVILQRIQSWVSSFPISEQPALLKAIRENLLIYGSDETELIMLTTSDGRTCSIREDVIATLCERWQGAVAIFMETASLVHGGDELNEDLLVLVTALKRIARRTQAAVCLIRHISKSAAREGIEDSLVGRGGASFSDAVRSAMLLRELTDKEAGDEGIDLYKLGGDGECALLKLIHTKANYSKKEAPIYILRRDDLQQFKRVEPRGKAVVHSERLLAFMQRESAAGITEWSASQLKKSCMETNVPQRCVNAALEQLERQERIMKAQSHKGGQHAVWVLRR
ncbi:hypothetical protein D3C78_270870 [compost metagenome]